MIWAQVPAAPSPSTSPRLIYVLPLRDEVEQTMVYLARRGVKEAMEQKADALIVHLDTNGGRGDAMEEIMAALDKFRPLGQTYTYIDTKAYSAGAFIASATRHIYMAPGAVIGAATPILLSPGGAGVQETPKSFEEKMTSAFLAKLRASTEKNGHHAAVFEAMVDRDKGLIFAGQEILPKGKILTLTNTEAEKKYGSPPRPLLSEGTFASLDEMVKTLGGTAYKKVTFEPSGFERLARWITALTPLLMTAAMILGYLEFQKPGFGLAGGLAIVFFLLVFFGHYVAGLSGFEPLLLFLVGAILIGAELYFFPGLIVPAMTGAVLLLAALLLMQVDRYPTDSFFPSAAQLQAPVLNLALSFAATLFAAALLARYLPKRLFYAQLEQATVSGPSLELAPQIQVGAEGLALTNLRPSGTARFEGSPVDVITDGRLIDSGTPVRITVIEGVRIVVEPV
jgi:membrane-bound serine protease (ClpP class)